MNDRPRTAGRGGVLFSAALSAAMLALGINLLIGVIGHMRFLSRLRREGVVVHGWVAKKHPNRHLLGFGGQLVEFRYWPEREHDKPFAKAGEAAEAPPVKTAGPRKPDTRAKALDAEVARRLLHGEPEPAEEKEPLGGQESKAVVSGRVAASLQAGDWAPVTLIRGRGGGHTIGRVDGGRAWRVLLWRGDEFFGGVALVGVGGVVGVFVLAEYLRQRAAAQQATRGGKRRRARRKR